MNKSTKAASNRFLLGVAFLLVGRLTGKINTNLFVAGLLILIILTLGYYLSYAYRNPKK